MKAKEVVKLYAGGNLNASDLISKEDKRVITIDYNQDLNLQKLPEFHTTEEFLEYMGEDEYITKKVTGDEWYIVYRVLLRACSGDRMETHLLIGHFEEGDYWDEYGNIHDLVTELHEYVRDNGYVEVAYTNLPYEERKGFFKKWRL